MTTLNRMLVRKGALALAVSAVMLAGCNSGSDSGSSDGPQVPLRDTAQGPVAGATTSYGVAFKGIPYAKPPVGELRLAPPQPLEVRGDEALEATEFGGSCIQPASTFGVATSTEDCLYLNVYAPANAEGLPVMVWIHGGALETGSGDTYDPTGLVNEGVIVVTINYRLGVLGFLSHPDLADEDENGYSGNYGFMDQLMALEWVQENIPNFGGDPANVTIFGESAGGLSVMAHVVSPAAEGLFSKAIVQSGAYSGAQPSQATVEDRGATFYEDRLECTDIACIRELDAQAILTAQAQGGLNFVPNLRGDLLPLSIGEALATNQYTKVPMIAGVNRDEGRLFVAIAELGRIAANIAGGMEPLEAAMAAALQPEDYIPEIQTQLGGASAEAAGMVAALYPQESEEFGGNTSVALSAIVTDVTFNCPGISQISSLSEQTTVYGYEFSDRNAPSIIPAGNTFPLGAAHAFEIQYVFGSDEAREARGMAPEQVDLARDMTRAWAQFATTGNPNAETIEGAAWMEFSEGSNLIEFIPGATTTLSEADFNTRHRCEFWSGLGG